MLKMKLPVKPEEGIVETAEDKLAETFECNLHLPGAACQSLRRHLDSPDLVQKIQDRETDLATRLISKEIVYEWFGLLLSSAQRIEFICGLLDLCNPLELRFLGSCLEDLARKDYHFLRDSEMRANSPSDIGHLKDVTDTEVRSKLLVYLALMRSENRECAGLLYRVLAHMDTLVNNYPLPNTFAYRGSSEHDSKHGSEAECPVDNGVRMEDELLLLLTMATLHPAFTFRQRVGLRDTLEELKKRVADCASRVPCCPCNDCELHYENGLCKRSGYHDYLLSPSHRLQRNAVHIEKIFLKSVSRRRADRHIEYTFEVTWSDSSVNTVTKNHQELQKFLLNLPKESCADAFNKTILRALNQGQQKREEKRHTDMDSLRGLLLKAPQAFLQSQEACNFFLYKPTDFSSLRNNRISPHLKKQSGNYPFKTVGCKCHLVDEVNTVYAEHNGVTDRKNAVMRELYINGLSHGKPVGIQTPEEWDLALENKKNSLPLLDKFKVTNVDTRANSIDNSSLSKTTNRTEKDPRLELVSGVDMFGETTSENYSSPSSPRLNGRESFESEEKDRGCDSICEEFMKLENKTDFISCHGTRVVTGRPTAQVAPVFNDSGTCSEISLNASEFQHTAVKSCSQCNVQSGAQETEHDGSCSVATVDRKPSEMHVADAVCSSDVTEAPVLSFSRSGKEAELASSSSLVGPAAFVTRAVQAGCSHQAQTIRMATSHLDSNVCTTMGLQPPGSTNQGSSTVFISVQPGNMPESPSVASDSTPTAVVTNAFGLSSLLSQNEGTSGMNLQSNNLKGLVASPGLPGTPFAYALPGALFPTSVLPTQSTGILNSTAAASPPPPAVAVGQVQSGSAVSVPVHTPDPAHSPSLTYSAASGENASYINCLGNSPNRTVLPQQPVGSGACNSCGRGCSCGTRSGDMNFYYPAPQGQHYRLQVFPFPSVCNSSYLSQAHQNSGTQLPFFLPQAPYANGLIPDPLLGSQASYGIQQMAGFQRYYYPMFQAPVVVPNANGLVPKKNGIMSCCNCGASGHFSPDCKQPPMEASQQVTFRLKCAPLPPKNLNSAN